MSGDVWNNGMLGEAFDPDNNFTRTDFTKSASNKDNYEDRQVTENEAVEANADQKETEKFAGADNKYPIETIKEAARSLKRASEQEPQESFLKIARKIKNYHPEITDNPSEHMDKAASIGYEIGRNMGKGMIETIKEASE